MSMTFDEWISRRDENDRSDVARDAWSVAWIESANNSAKKIAGIAEAVELAAEIIGSDVRNVGVIEAALTWQRQIIAERDAEIARLRKDNDTLLDRIDAYEDELGDDDE